VCRTVETLHGHLLQLHHSSDETPAVGVGRGVYFSYSESVSSLFTTEHESCKEGSILLEVDTMLTQGLPIDRLRGMVPPANRSEAINSSQSDACALYQNCSSEQQPFEYLYDGTEASIAEETYSDSLSQHGNFWPLSLGVACCVVLLLAFYLLMKVAQVFGHGNGHGEAEPSAHPSLTCSRSNAALHTASEAELAAILHNNV
jgi:hypothetical protein